MDQCIQHQAFRLELDLEGTAFIEDKLSVILEPRKNQAWASRRQSLERSGMRLSVYEVL